MITNFIKGHIKGHGHDRGFTLIELLVVIAIIGVLASVVLASLNTARNKGADAAVKSNLNGMRAQAELFYDNGGSTYTGVCADPNMSTAMTAASDAIAGTPTAGGLGDGECNANAGGTEWAAWVNLKTAGTYHCVDSSGDAKVTTGGYLNSTGAVTACP